MLCIVNLHHWSIYNNFGYLGKKSCLKSLESIFCSFSCHSTCSCWSVHRLPTKCACWYIALTWLVLPATSFTLVTVHDSRGQLKPWGSIQNAELNICWVVAKHSEYCCLLMMFTCRKNCSYINPKYHMLKFNPFSYLFLVILCKTFS